jgi:hypothetical protein
MYLCGLNLKNYFLTFPIFFNVVIFLKKTANVFLAGYALLQKYDKWNTEIMIDFVIGFRR